jgi:hypothetical protein
MQSPVLIAPLMSAPLPSRSLLLAPCSLPLWPDSGPVGEKEEKMSRAAARAAG